MNNFEKEIKKQTKNIESNLKFRIKSIFNNMKFILNNCDEGWKIVWIKLIQLIKVGKFCWIWICEYKCGMVLQLLKTKKSLN